MPLKPALPGPRDPERLRRELREHERAVAQHPDSAAAYLALGRVLHEAGRYKDAVARIDAAIALDPDNAQAHHRRATALHALGALDAAAESYARAAAIKPDHVAAHANRGNVLRKLGRLDEALLSYRAALEHAPEHPGLHVKHGNVLQELKQFDEALECYDRAIALQPAYAEAYSNRGGALKELGAFDEAMRSFDQALAIDPDYVGATANKAMVHLLHGEFSIGWHGYEAIRRQDAAGYRKFAKPLWLGQFGIAGKTILVHGEQGFGDVIQFARYVPLLEASGARVLFAPQRELRSLMRSLDGKARIVDADDERLLFDCHCPMMSLAPAFRTELATIPPAPYLSADPAKVEQWRLWLGERTRPRVGVVWSGNVRPDKGRSIPFGQFEVLFGHRCEFICLQKKVPDAERAALSGAGALCPGEDLVDFSDTAALCTLMDLIISIDTGVAHLAGALGQPVWLLLPWLPDWRWLLGRDDSPWYPSMRLFRQPGIGDWAGVVRQVDAALAARFT